MGMAPTGNGEKKEVKSRALLDATAGALAGALARFVVGPLDVLKIRFQVQLEPIARSQGAKSTSQLSMGSKYTGMRQALVTIVREEGIQVSTCPIHPSYVSNASEMFYALHNCRHCCECLISCTKGYTGLKYRLRALICAGALARHCAGAAVDRPVHSSPVRGAAAVQELCKAAWPPDRRLGLPALVREWCRGWRRSYSRLIPI